MLQTLRHREKDTAVSRGNNKYQQNQSINEIWETKMHENIHNLIILYTH